MIKRTNNKESVLAVVLLLLLVFRYTGNRYVVTGAILYIVLALAFEPVAVGTDVVWRRLTQGLGIVSNAVLLSALFFLFVLPVGVVRRVFKKGSFVRYSDKLTSTFEVREKVFSKKDLEQPF